MMREYTDEELNRVAGKVEYEIQMLRYCAEWFSDRDINFEESYSTEVFPLSSSGDYPNALEVYTYLECFLLHARVLRDFFCVRLEELEKREKARKNFECDDIVAQHFSPSFSPPASSDYPVLHKEKIRIDKSLAHLTSKRLEYEEEDSYWHGETIYTELENMIQKFLESLPDDRALWFKKTQTAEIISFDYWDET